MKSDTNSKILTLAATALLGVLFAGNANAMADVGHRNPMPQAGELEKSNDAQKTGMLFVGGRVGWIRLPEAAGTARTVDLEGRGDTFSPKPSD